jgi:hypothetical protein
MPAAIVHQGRLETRVDLVTKAFTREALASRVSAMLEGIERD